MTPTHSRALDLLRIRAPANNAAKIPLAWATSWPASFPQRMTARRYEAAGITAYSLLAELGGADTVASLSGFDPASGRFRTAAYTADGEPAGGDFPIVNGSGYLIFMHADLPAFRAW